MRELIVTRHHRDLAWVQRCRVDRVTIYDKGPDPWPGSIVLPNVGIDTHSHLHHLVERYNDLPELLVTAQDEPFEHSPNLVEVLAQDDIDGMWRVNQRLFPDSRARADGYLGLGRYKRVSQRLVTTDPLVAGHPVHEAFHRRKYQLIERIWRHLWPDRSLPDDYPSTWGSQLVLSRQRIILNDQSTYRWLRDLHLEDPLAPYAMENLWWYLMRCDTIPTLTQGNAT